MNIFWILILKTLFWLNNSEKQSSPEESVTPNNNNNDLDQTITYEDDANQKSDPSDHQIENLIESLNSTNLSEQVSKPNVDLSDEDLNIIRQSSPVVSSSPSSSSQTTTTITANSQDDSSLLQSSTTDMSLDISSSSSANPNDTFSPQEEELNSNLVRIKLF